MKHAIVGCGRVAPNHAFGASQAGVEITACCDVDPKRAKDFAQRHSIPRWTTNCDELFADESISSVSVCTDHGSHARIAAAALKLGNHVLIEKPIATTLEDALAIIQQRNLSGRKVSVCLQHRFDPLIRGIRNAVRQGRLGVMTGATAMVQCRKDNEYYSGWRGKQDTEGGSTLINQGIHTLDLLIWMLGSPRVLGAGKDAFKFMHEFENEDTSAAVMRMEDGPLVTLLSTNTSVVEWESWIELIGTRGRIRFTTDFPNTVELMDLADDALGLQLRELEAQRTGPPPTISYYGYSHKDLLANFFSAIRGDTELEVTAEDGTAALAAVLKIYSKSLSS